jgi:hypothetical protein
MNKVIQKHAIVWMPYEKNSEIAKKVGAKGDIELPFLVYGEEAARLNRGEGANVDGFNLMLGLLVEYFTTPILSIREDRPYFKDILMGLLEEFRSHRGYDSIEQCIMVVSAYLTDNHGESYGIRALKTGLEIVPGSSKIKEALIQKEV